MLGQTIAEQFSFEGLLIPYFIILALTIELALYFIIQKLTRKEQSPTWILTFSVTMFAFSGVYVVRALKDLAFIGSVTMAKVLYQIDFIIISLSGIAIGVLMRLFFKSGKPIARLLPLLVILLGSTSLVLNLHSTFVTGEISPVLVALGASLMLPVVGFPVYVLFQLAKRDESGYKQVFIVIMAGIILSFIGLAFNFQSVQNIIVLVIIIAGLAMITFGFFYIPPVDDFFWVNQLVAIYVLDKATRIALFKKIYDQKVVDGFSFGGRQAGHGAPSESAFVSGISGITEMLSETAAADGKKVELIDQGPVKLFLSYQGNLVFVLLAKQAMPVFNSKLQSFKDDFLLFFGDMISRFASNPEKFLPAETIATRIFGTAGEKKRWNAQ
ncbi:MAG: hypothetical protein Q6373_018580 [Candidatus Sigynarchaeota archaeon]